MEDKYQQAINKVIESVNRKQKAAVDLSNDPDGYVQKWINEQRKLGFKRTGKAGWVKIASIPMVVDLWFTKTYGADYFKDPDFFERKHPEWKVVKNTKTI